MIYLGNGSYIDTSLITCSEYQLFLDEQRSEGRFFQPDHWSKASFPEGQGRAPVLGVRPSDALAFCEWLTKGDPGIWQYCLPTLNEHRHLEKEKDIALSTETEIGYWIEDGKKFAWIKNMPPAFNVYLNTMQEFFNRKDIVLRSSDLDKLKRPFPPLNIENIWTRVSALEADRVFGPMLTHAHILEEARFSDHAYARRLVNVISSAKDHFHVLVGNLVEIFEAFSARFPGYRPDRALDFTCKIIQVLNTIRNIELEGHQLVLNAYDSYFELAITLLHLDARIKGLISATEGILLARQRRTTNKQWER